MSKANSTAGYQLSPAYRQAGTTAQLRLDLFPSYDGRVYFYTIFLALHSLSVTKVAEGATSTMDRRIIRIPELLLLN